MTDLATAGRRRLLDTIQRDARDEDARDRALYLLVALLIIAFVLLSIAVVGRPAAKSRATSPALPPCPEQR